MERAARECDVGEPCCYRTLGGRTFNNRLLLGRYIMADPREMAVVCCPSSKVWKR